MYADPISEDEKKQIEEGTEKLTEAEKKLKEVEEQISTVATNIDLAQAEIESTNDQVEKIEKDIKSSEVEIDVLKEDISGKEELLGDRLNTIYKAGGANSYLQLLLSSESISDFFGRASALNTILDLDKTALEDLTDKQDQLSRKIDKLNADKEKVKELEATNKAKVEEEKKHKEELDKLYKEYENNLNAADTELSSSEKALYEYWSNIISKSSSTIKELEDAKKTLESVKGQLRSKKAKQEVESLIASANKKITTKKQAASASSQSSYVGTATGTAGDIIAYGSKYVGCPYVWGATGPNSFDCSGFVGYVFRHFGISLQRNTYGQMTQGVAVSRANLQPGDIIFTESGGHVGIYVGGNSMLHAANSKQGVIIGPIYHYYCARRVL